MAQTRPITPFLWFDHEAEEAAAFYTGILKKLDIAAIRQAYAG
jgi:predicted 3-demethylubiquinone-9 3-methyltransferase (glyoxalase superfamily)